MGLAQDSTGGTYIAGYFTYKSGTYGPIKLPEGFRYSSETNPDWLNVIPIQRSQVPGQMSSE